MESFLKGRKQERIIGQRMANDKPARPQYKLPKAKEDGGSDKKRGSKHEGEVFQEIETETRDVEVSGEMPNAPKVSMVLVEGVVQTIRLEFSDGNIMELDCEYPDEE